MSEHWHNRTVRMSAKAEYATRAMVQLAASEAGTLSKAEDLAAAQDIPPSSSSTSSPI
jgi:DNA-binding IscR family transcriptional regulator